MSDNKNNKSQDGKVSNTLANSAGASIQKITRSTIQESAGSDVQKIINSKKPDNPKKK